VKKRWSALVLATGLLGAATVFAAKAECAALPLIQMNIAGAAFGPEVLPGQLYWNYFFPSVAELEQWRVRHIKVIRFPVLWERLQPKLNGAFDPTYATLIDTLLKQAATKGMTVILDVHNYGLYRGQVLGSAQVPLTAYQDLFSRIAGRWNTSKGLHGYDLMNEPHDAADAGWAKAAQAGINGVRSMDKRRPIYIEGRGWSSAMVWPELNDDLARLKDPANNLIYSAHLYLDANTSGTYQSGPGANFDTKVGVNRAKPFVEWLKRHGKQGHIGEFGFPGNDPRWDTAATALFKYLKANCIPLAYWAAGSVWGNYPLSVEPSNGVDKPQWKTIAPFVNSGGCKLTY
jgi:endoglucanase